MAENTTVEHTPGLTHIEVEAGVRYWEDATVNGLDEDNDAPTIFGADGETWKVRIKLATGKVEGWPTGMIADVHYKVCDAGVYYLTDEQGNRLRKWNGYYVPNDFLCPNDEGYGDYIIMEIDGDGMIADWSEPEIDKTEWSVFTKASPRAGEG